MLRSNAGNALKLVPWFHEFEMSDKVEEFCRRVSYKVQNQNRAMTVESNNPILTVD